MTDPFKDPKVLARFWAKVDKRGDGECWPWKAGCIPGGYGEFWLNGTNALAHRFAWEVANQREVPAGMDILHNPRCEFRRCVNSAHLRPGTDSENMLDKLVSGTHHEANKTHCPLGHAYDMVKASGARGCSACTAISNRKYRIAHREELRAGLRERKRRYVERHRDRINAERRERRRLAVK